MNLVWKTASAGLLLMLLCVATASVCLAESQKVAFTANEKQLINEYYRKVGGTLAPGSIDRNPLPFNIEQGLKIGARLAMTLEKKIERLPEKLESQLPLHASDYKRFRVGNHVLLLKTSDWTIVDIIRNAGMKTGG